MTNKSNKEQFCQYLEEVAAELRIFPSTKKYIYDLCSTLIEQTIEFEKDELTETRIRPIK